MDNTNNNAPALPEGVFLAQKKDKSTYFRSSLTYKNKHISLGSYPTDMLAHCAYLEGKKILFDKTMTLMSYSAKSPLSFEKWVSLLNFRDNGIYFGTPIYMGQKLFYYYMDPATILKFDLDDLFYFSSHKIMRRGNHFFVADYGSQISITSRFGIKPYSVPGRDFTFLNGDNLDFRRENLNIQNTYHGVKIVNQNNKTVYRVTIHVRGNLVVGEYDTLTEAAIAYNKAADFLHKRGIRKDYLTNYIENLPPSKYAEIYSGLKISEKIRSYTPKKT